MAQSENRDWPRAGERALVISACGQPSMVGKVVNVTSDPLPMPAGLHVNFGLSPRGRRNLLSSEAGVMASRYRFGEIDWIIATHRLIRIPPDSEAKALFQDEPIEADVGVGR